jgi:hypothetical protein
MPRPRVIIIAAVLTTLGTGAFMLPEKSSCCPSGDPNQIVTKVGPRGQSYSQSVLVEVVRSKDSGCLQELLSRGGDPNTKDFLGRPLLYQAIALSREDMEAAKRNVQLLLDKGADMNAVGAGATTALSAAQVLAWEFVAYLIEKGADIHYSNRLGMTIASVLEKDIKINPNPGTAAYAAHREKVKGLLIKQGIIIK